MSDVNEWEEELVKAGFRRASPALRMATGKEMVDSLELASLRLASARATMDRETGGSNRPSETRMGELDEALESARARYREIISERCGQSADEIERRLSL